MVAEDFGYCMPGTVDDLHCTQRAAVPLSTLPRSPWRSSSSVKSISSIAVKIGTDTADKSGIVETRSASPTPSCTQPHACTASVRAASPWMWHLVSQAACDPILQSQHHLRQDTSGIAVDLSVGAYRDASGRSTEFRCIKAARDRLSDRPFSHNYLPLSGDSSLRSQMRLLVFGDSIDAHSVAVVQTVSGSGAVRLGLELCRRHLGASDAFVSDPSWPNHAAMASACDLQVKRYAYYDRKSRTVCGPAMMENLRSATRGSVVVLHACAHNPTGADLTKKEWMEVAEVVEKRGLLPLFDIAYQGLASGDVDEDADAVRMFVKKGIPVLVASSMSKSMGLYNSRVGTLHVALPGYTKETVDAVLSQMTWLARAMNSSPPAYGALLAKEVLQDEKLRMMWMEELNEMTRRTRLMRRRLKEELEEAGGADWTFVQNGCGMFVVIGMTEKQVKELRERWHVYLGPEGRLNVCGLTEQCARRVARGIVTVLGTRDGTE